MKGQVYVLVLCCFERHLLHIHRATHQAQHRGRKGLGHNRRQAVLAELGIRLDHRTERPLLFEETEPPLHEAGFVLSGWQTCAFLGFCLLMNSDVLVANRLLRFVPGIRSLTRWAAAFDEFCLRLPGLRRAGLQVVGWAEKPR